MNNVSGINPASNKDATCAEASVKVSQHPHGNAIVVNTSASRTSAAQPLPPATPTSVNAVES